MNEIDATTSYSARTLRLVSNYGFLEEPSLLIRATRYRTRLGWELDPRTQTRYENAKEEGVIEHLSAEARSKELEQIGHEEEGLNVLRALEAEGWMKVLFPAWTSAKADEEKLKALHELAVELLLQGVHADMSAGQMQLLTAKLSVKDLAALKKLMLRPGFVAEWNSLDELAAGFAKVLLAKENAVPSASYKLFTSYDPEAILWLGFTSKVPAVLERFNLFLKVWPEARQRIPHALMQEMRITPELTAYREILQTLFLELIDGRLTTPEEARGLLEPHSPPAPPPQVTIKRPRAKRGADKVKEHSFEDDEDSDDDLDEDDDLDDIGGDDEEIDLGLALPKVILGADSADDAADEDGDEDEEHEAVPAPAKHAPKAAAQPKPGKAEAAPAPVKAEKPQPAAKAKPEPKAAAKPAPAAKPVAKPVLVAAPAKHKPVPPAKPAPHAKPAPVAAKKAKPEAKKAAVKVPAKPAAKVPAKAPAKPPVKTHAPAGKPSPAKGKPVPPAKHALPAKHSKPAEKKLVPKPAKKR